MLRNDRDFENKSFEDIRLNELKNFDNYKFDNQFAVCVRDVTLSYGIGSKKVHALNGINISVPKGTIYSLLGPSGCGKTSILRCILGCISASSGIIKVFGYKPHEEGGNVPGCGVGYMPQDIALHEDLTIEEMLIYFGKIFALDETQLKQRINRFISFLQLPEKNRLIGQLSGGQKRRASFACAIIHQPDLLILDEPTVGVDPILREKIWDILMNYTEREKKNVIITTHYIEETKRSHLVGFMRKGIMLEENTPKELISKYEATSLEDVFTKVCLKQKKSKKRRLLLHRQISKERSRRYTSKETLKEPKRIKWRTQNTIKDFFSKVYAVYWKIMIQSFRQRAEFVAQFVLPVTILFLFSSCIGIYPITVSLAVFNQEQPANLSKLFLNCIDKEVVNLQFFNDFNSAIAGVKKAKFWGVLHIRQNFSESLLSEYEAIDELDVDEVLDEKMKLYADLSNTLKTTVARRNLDEAFQKFSIEVLSELNYNPRIFDLPIQMSEPIHGTLKEGNFFGLKTFYIPGILVILSYTFAFAMTVLSVITEKNEKIFDRNYASGVSAIHLIVGHLIARFTYMSINVMLMFLMAVYGFRIPVTGSFFLAFLLLLSLCIVGLANGVLISAVLPNLHYATILSNGILLFMFITSGVMWSVKSMPYWFRWFTYFMPVTIPAESFRHILSSGLTLTNIYVYSGFLILCFYFLLFFISTIVLIRF